MSDPANLQPCTAGFIGTGIMGAHMARRPSQAGHRVRAWNRTADKAARLASFGVQVCADAGGACWT